MVRATLKHEQAGEHREHLRQMVRQASAVTEQLEEQANHGIFGPLCKQIVRRLIRTYRGYI